MPIVYVSPREYARRNPQAPSVATILRRLKEQFTGGVQHYPGAKQQGNRFLIPIEVDGLPTPPTMITLAVWNQAGGVGKTTVTHNLGWILSSHGLKVLLVDFDPSQANLTTYCGLHSVTNNQTAEDALLKGSRLKPVEINPFLHVVPTNLQMALVERRLAPEPDAEYRLRNALEQVAGDYHICLIDCPPTLGLLNLMSSTAANYLLVPVTTKHKAMLGIGLIFHTLSEIRRYFNKTLMVLGIVPTAYARHNKHDQAILQAMHDLTANSRPSFTLFDPIPYSTDVTNASSQGLPLYEYAPKRPATVAFFALAQKLADLLGFKLKIGGAEVAVGAERNLEVVQ